MGHPAHHPHEAEDLDAVGGHCPRCGAEYRPGFHLCADCQVPLVPGPAPPPPSSPEVEAYAVPHRDVAVVCSLPWQEAWLMAGRLRTTGIDAAVSPDDFTAFTYFRRSSFDVLVPADRLEDARKIVSAFLRGIARSP